MTEDEIGRIVVDAALMKDGIIRTVNGLEEETQENLCVLAPLRENHSSVRTS